MFAFPATAQINNTEKQQDIKVISGKKINSTSIEIVLSNNQRQTLDFYGENIFRLFQDNNGGVIRDPEAKPKAQILVNNPRKPVSMLTIKDENGQIFISIASITMLIDKNTNLFKIINQKNQALVAEEIVPIAFDKNKHYRQSVAICH